MRQLSRSTFAGLSLAAFLGLSLFTSTVSATELSCASCQQTPGSSSSASLASNQTYEETSTGGRLIEGGVVVATVTNDAQNRVAFSTIDGVRSDFTYDAKGRIVRIVDSVNGTQTHLTSASYQADGLIATIERDGIAEDVAPYNQQLRQIKQQKPQRPAKLRPTTPGKPIDFCNRQFTNCNNGCSINEAGAKVAATAAYAAAIWACKINVTCQRIAHATYIAAMVAADSNGDNCREKCMLDHEGCINGY